MNSKEFKRIRKANKLSAVELGALLKRETGRGSLDIIKRVECGAQPVTREYKTAMLLIDCYWPCDNLKEAFAEHMEIAPNDPQELEKLFKMFKSLV